MQAPTPTLHSDYQLHIIKDGKATPITDLMICQTLAKLSNANHAKKVA